MGLMVDALFERELAELDESARLVSSILAAAMWPATVGDDRMPCGDVADEGDGVLVSTAAAATFADATEDAAADADDGGGLY